MYRSWVLLILLCMGAMLSACGQTGDLYLPDTPSAEQEEEKKD